MTIGRLDLAGRVVVVTGASRGIGAAVARRLSARGAAVVGVARDEQRLSAVMREVAGTSVGADLADPAIAERIVERTLSTHGRLDALVANAGVGYAGPFAEMPAERIAEVLAVDLTAPLLLTRAALGALRRTGELSDGRRAALVYVTSIAGLVGVPGEAVYSAAKAGLESFAAALRAELRRERISVSTVALGVVDTDFLRARQSPYARRFPRPMPVERAADAVLWALETGADRIIRPRWLAGPAWLAGTTPRLYRAAERRFG